MLERLPGDLEQEALLGIQLIGLTRRNAEEARIEAAHVVEECTPAHGSLNRVDAGLVFQDPSIGRDRAHGVHSCLQRPPECLGIAAPTREATTHADHCDRLTARPLELAELGL